MEGKYIIEAKAYNKKYGMVSSRKVFRGDKKEAYEKAMKYAYDKVGKFAAKGTDFSVTIQGEGWRTASNVNP